MRRGAVLGGVVVLLAATVACGDDGSASDARADQIRAAAEEAGLAEDVVDALVLAARGVDGTFQVTYPGAEGASLVISQEPPDRRVDVVVGERVTESRVFRDGVGYRCAPPADDPLGSLDCTRSEGTLQPPGAFTEAAIQAFTEELIDSSEDAQLTVEHRTIAETDATCLVAGADTLCLSDEGAQLLVLTGEDRLEATSYTTDVPDGTFDT